MEADENMRICEIRFWLVSDWIWKRWIHGSMGGEEPALARALLRRFGCVQIAANVLRVSERANEVAYFTSTNCALDEVFDLAMVI